MRNVLFYYLLTIESFVADPYQNQMFKNYNNSTLSGSYELNKGVKIDPH